MVAIQPGTGGTFKTATAEARAIEALCFLQLQEADTTKNPNNRQVISGSFDTEDLTFSGTYAFPADQTLSSGVGLVIVATNYLVGVTVAPGGNTPTFAATRLEQYCLEVLQYLQASERVAANNPTSRNAISGTFNSDTGLYQGAFSLPVGMTLTTDGKPLFAAIEYLI